MSDENKKLPGNMLTAEELLRNKGIKCVAWDEFEKSTKILPKTGKKQFEPNDSWLQNMQIEKGIKTHKDLIGIERVNRVSQLASAEWLPAEKRAQVKKHSGQDWSNFGVETNGALYLIPEEAIFLLEANCLELTWNNVPLSIQQAYEVLIDNVECSMEEYRVYSQLVRYGYRVQRFVYQCTEQHPKNDKTVITKRKVIIDPENGLRMTDSQQPSRYSERVGNEKPRDSQGKVDVDISDSDVEICQDTAILETSIVENDVHRVIEDLITTIENMEIQCANSARKSNTKSPAMADTHNSQIARFNGEGKRQGSKVEIISEETFLGDIKIVNQSPNNTAVRNWRGSRIQRNVKLLPRRSDKPSIGDTALGDSNNKVLQQCSEKRKIPSLTREEFQTKKLRHEVIELSDDEIQEEPRSMTRMEILNMIPNIAGRSTITEKISRGYIPHSIKPSKNVYHYQSQRLRNLRDSDKTLYHRKRSEGVNNNNNNNNNNANQSTFQCNNTSRNGAARRYSNDPIFNQKPNTNIHGAFTRDFCPMDKGHSTNFSSPHVYNNRYPFAYNQSAFWHQRNTLFQNELFGFQNHGGAIHHHNRFLTIQMNNFAMPNMTNNALRNSYLHCLRQSFHQNCLPQRRHYQHHRVVENMSVQCNASRSFSYSDHRQRYVPREHSGPSSSNYNGEVCQPSFNTLPGPSSWAELKTKWREEKTITIEDEDSTRRDEIGDESGEVQLVEELCNPLVGPKNANSLADIFNRLRIIKSAPDATVRRKRTKYKISYNVYSSSQHYKKASPGVPLYRVIVIKQKDDRFLQPADLHRLQQDSKNGPIVVACVSMSISYIQPGFISLPNLMQLK